IRAAGAEIAETCFVIDLPDLGGASRVRTDGVEVYALIASPGHRLVRPLRLADDGWSVEVLDQTRLPPDVVTRRLGSPAHAADAAARSPTRPTRSARCRCGARPSSGSPPPTGSPWRSGPTRRKPGSRGPSRNCSAPVSRR